MIECFLFLGNSSPLSFHRDLSTDARGVGSTIPPYLYVCPFCLEPWARVWWPGAEEAWIESNSCERCWRFVWPPKLKHKAPGSLIEVTWWPGNIDWGLLPLLPPALKRREFNLHIKARGIELELADIVTADPINTFIG